MTEDGIEVLSFAALAEMLAAGGNAVDAAVAAALVAPPLCEVDVPDAAKAMGDKAHMADTKNKYRSRTIFSLDKVNGNTHNKFITRNRISASSSSHERA